MCHLPVSGLSDMLVDLSISVLLFAASVAPVPVVVSLLEEPTRPARLLV